MFLPSSGANTPSFCTWQHVFAALRCKYTPFLHLAPCFRRPQVQIHPIFAPGTMFLPSSGANTPPFCTWQHVFAVLRCKYTPFLHLATRFCRPQVQIHPIFAPGNTFTPSSGANTPPFCTWGLYLTGYIDSIKGGRYDSACITGPFAAGIQSRNVNVFKCFRIARQADR